MKKTILSVCSGLILGFTTQTASADHMPTTSLPMSKILQDLQEKGYGAFKEVEFEHNIYEIEAIGPQGNKLKLKVNPQTGELINDKHHPMSVLAAVQKLESSGYHNIYKIEFDDNKYEMRALDKDGKKVTLKINANNGEIKKEGWF